MDVTNYHEHEKTRTDNMAIRQAKTILLVEDDPNTATLLAVYLRREGFQIVTAHDGAQVMALFGRHQPVFVILDLMLPNVDGWDICRELRHDSDVPILILTARQEESDRVLGLMLGADDYVEKPFSPRELVARVHALLRRHRHGAGDGVSAAVAESFVIGEVEVDLAGFEMRRGDEVFGLSPKEAGMLALLYGEAGKAVRRERFLDEVWGSDQFVGARTVDTHMLNLRNKLEVDPKRPRHLLTVYGVGYRLVLT